MVRELAWFALWSTTMIAATTINTNMTAPVVDLGYAQYQGYFDSQTNITSFLSIRYAAPPLGEYRLGSHLIVLPTVALVLITSIPTRKLEVSSTSAACLRIWCTICYTEPRYVLSSRIRYQRHCAHLTVRTQPQQTTKHDAGCF